MTAIFPERMNNPDYQASETLVSRMLVARQGDGYEQRTPDGLHSTRRRWSELVWERPQHEAQVVWEFLLPLFASGASFLWTAPDYAVPARVWCPALSRSFPSYGTTRITADFEEVFDI